jgi:hypothetical protein
MIAPPASDFWRVGIVPAPIARAMEPAALAGLRGSVVWLPDAGPWRYLADPFGVWRDGALHVFVEAFDYRTKHAVIERHEFGRDLGWRGRTTALAASCHLSYPFLVEDGGEIFMVPESHRAGEIALYRARRFPDDWVRETVLLRDLPGAEASLLRHEGRWWMFFTVVGPRARDQRELHVAWAETLTGPWRLYPGNPVLDDRRGARPGGTPFVGADGAVILPVQDCSESYGGAVRFLRFGRLTPESIVVETLAPRLTGGLISATHREGLHTLAGCGDVTLVDVKRIVRSWARHPVNLGMRFRRLLRRRR